MNFSALLVIFCLFSVANQEKTLNSLKKKQKKVNFPVEKESQLTNKDDYRLIWMLDIVRDR
jgi:hypothetical protein